MQTKRLLRQGCEAYLAYVVDREKGIPDIKEVEVVNEFEDVFPDDLSGLPPDREIEFDRISTRNGPSIESSIPIGPCGN